MSGMGYPRQPLKLGDEPEAAPDRPLRATPSPFSQDRSGRRSVGAGPPESGATAARRPRPNSCECTLEPSYVRPAPVLSFELEKTRAELRAELSLAEQVQISMLPRHLPAVSGLEFGAIYRPCTQLSGDFFNVFRLDRDHVGMYVGDVCGHGVAAALLGVFAMQRIVTKQIDGSEYRILPPSESLGRLNAAMLDAQFPADFFLTLTYGIFDTQRGSWTYASAGHPSSLLFRHDGSVIRLEAEGPPLGLFPARFRDEESTLAPGDRVLLMTDGVDTMQWGGQGRATSGLIAAFPRHDGVNAQTLLDGLEAEAEPADGFRDDLTLLLVDWNPDT